MSRRAIIVIKTALHLVCLAPFAVLLRQYTSGQLALNPDPIAFITHYTGDWAVWMLLLSLAVTPVRRISPRIAWLIRLRRILGLYAFFYATLHLATYIFLFSGYDILAAVRGVGAGHPGAIVEQWQQIWPTIWDDVLKRRFIQVGFLAWVVLLALAVTSPTFVLRAIGGKSWQWLHRLVYVAGFAAIIHYWWLVKPGVTAPLPVTLVLAVLLVARIGYAVYKRVSRSRPALEATKI